MRTADECLREAEQCERYAATSHNEDIKNMFTRFAKTWRRLAAADSDRNSIAASAPSQAA